MSSTYYSVLSITVTTASWSKPWTLPSLYSPIVAVSIFSNPSKSLYSLNFLLSKKTSSVKVSTAGPPFFVLNLMPKSSSGPAGLWLADRIIPPKQ